VNAFAVSIDGYGAGPDQDLGHPLGVGGEALHRWVFDTPTFRRLQAGLPAARSGAVADDGGADDDFMVRGFENVGAWIIGRNMFGPVRGPWPDDSWQGWWGPSPPYHLPVFVLTHHARAPLSMQGGTTFFFETDGILAALQHAKAAAGSRDVRLGGGVATIWQYLTAGLIDEIHLAIVPVLLGRGEHLLGGVDMVSLGYRCTEHVGTAQVTHVVLTK
jgi:dihydrofolate reductase